MLSDFFLHQLLIEKEDFYIEEGLIAKLRRRSFAPVQLCAAPTDFYIGK